MSEWKFVCLSTTLWQSKQTQDLLNKHNIEFLSLKYSGVCTHIKSKYDFRVSTD